MRSAILGAATLLATLALGVALLGTPGASAATSSVQIGSFAAGVGFGGTVELEARDIAPPGLSAWQVDITYDPDVVTVGDCTPANGSLCNPNLHSDTIRVTGVNVTGLEGDALLATIEFTCKAAGSSALALDVGTFADSTPGAPAPIDADVVNGKVTCTAGGGGPPPTPTPTPTPDPDPDGELPGDANCDSVVGAVDAALVLQFGAGLLQGLPCELNADVNGDGAVGAVDAALILQIAAGLI